MSTTSDAHDPSVGVQDADTSPASLGEEVITPFRDML